MYRRILITLENGPADATILEHASCLASQMHSELLLLHVADGWAARLNDQYKLVESDEIKADRNYLEETAVSLKARGLKVETLLGMGDPAKEILRIAEEKQCDLIAMAMHGHRFLADLILGTTISEVRHKSTIPLLLVRASKV